jgi:hypothetical protein
MGVGHAGEGEGRVGRRAVLAGGLLGGLALATLAPDGAAAAADGGAGVLAPAQAVAVANVASLAGVPDSSVTDGYAASADDTILLVGQSSAAENGPWVVGGDAWSRPADLPPGSTAGSCAILVGGGATYAGTWWVLPLTATIDVDGGAQPWQLVPVEASQLPASVVTSGYSAQPVVLTAADAAHPALQLVNPGSGGVPSRQALAIDTYGGGLIINQTVDFSAANQGPVDTIDCFLKSTGDGVCVYHQGGKPPGYSALAGGGAAFNCFIPYYLDDLATGRAGRVVNDRTGMLGLLIANQPTGNRAPSIYVEHYANSPAIQIVNQYTAFPNAGTADALSIWDTGSWSAVQVTKNTAPVTGHAAINVSTALPGPIDLFRGNDNHGQGRFLVRSDGTLGLGMNYPGAQPRSRLHVEANGSGVQTVMTLVNTGVSLVNHDGDGIELDFGGASPVQMAKVVCVVDSVSNADTSLRFSVRAGGRMTERLRLSGAGIGFFGAAPVAQQTMGAATAGSNYGANEQTMLQVVYNALRKLGLGS